ncbi:MAG: TRAP transporter substrate-binding protein DctP [Desulfobacterium sp.]|nr:TRAP transporter substrate-binding protein DctP [Desulfobacterium sp.]
MSYRTAIVILLFILTFGLTPAHATTLFKIATLAPEGAFEVVQMQAAAVEIATVTDGRVKFKFFTGGVMGNDQGVLRKIRINQLQGGALSSGSLSIYYPDSQVYSLPLVFRSFDEVDYVRKHMDETLIKGYEDAGFIVFGLAEGGFARIMSKTPISTVADLQQRKVWIPENDAAALEAVKAFDVNPITLSVADVRTALQTGLLDTVAIPPSYAILLHWHTQVHYITEIPLLYTNGLLAIEKRAFSNLSPGDGKIVKSKMAEAFARIDSHNRNQNIEAVEVLKEMGLTSVVLDDKARDTWLQRASIVPQGLVDKGVVSQEIVDTLNLHLSTFRSR